MAKSLQPLYRFRQASCGPPIFSRIQYRALHSTHSQREAITTPAEAVTTPLPLAQQPSKPPLSLLPLKTLVRSYLINSLSSTPIFLTPSLRIMTLLAHAESPLLNPDRNPILRFLLKHTFYANFCAGETRSEIQRTVNGLKGIGFTGVILAYAKEIVVHKDHDFSSCKDVDYAETVEEVKVWKEGNLKTIGLTTSGEFVGLKFTGAGREAVHRLAQQQPPSDILAAATTEICDFAKASNVQILFDAEQQALQPGIDAWTLHFQKLYNNEVPGKAIVYGTYQAYLRSTPAFLAEHLATASKEGFSLGVKLVRGAYINSDPRHLIWSTQEETDEAYDGIIEALIKKKYNQVLRSSAQTMEQFPNVSLVLASHNHQSVRKAMSMRRAQTITGEKKIDMAYGQLMGMADEVSCELALASKGQNDGGTGMRPRLEGPRVFKYLVWGSVGECMKYLLRRAEENKDAVLRARMSRTALKEELWRRMTGS
ncbi:MAG: hypothetical protein Q9195_001705 [Heterodermia aff. obscurata]